MDTRLFDAAVPHVFRAGNSVRAMAEYFKVPPREIEDVIRERLDVSEEMGQVIAGVAEVRKESADHRLALIKGALNSGGPGAVEQALRFADAPNEEIEKDYAAMHDWSHGGAERYATEVAARGAQ